MRFFPRPVRAAFASILVLLLAPSVFSQEKWSFLAIHEIGAPDFLAANPEYDGRGTVLFVLDTGVDMNIPGLRQTSTGEVKVIGARDFSGQGEVDLEKAEWAEGERVLVPADGIRLEGFDALAVQPSDPESVWTGVLEESAFMNNKSVSDLDDNGGTEGRWGIVVYAAAHDEVVAAIGLGAGIEMRRGWGGKAAEAVAEHEAQEEVWICVVDVDGDGQLDDEVLHRDYAVDYQNFTFKHVATEDSRELLSFAIDLSGKREPSLNLHHDDGGHGSHVAGMAAGYRVHGQEGLNGVAPGAYIYSLKLGHNLLAGGSTTTESMKKAYDFAVQWMETYGMPCAINMSYGIGSEIEGDAKMDRYLDDLLDEHSRMIIVNSAGNSGPGISTVGLPAAADGVIAAAALFTKDMALELYGARFEKDELYIFSSRGGELAKPDVAAPGGASSTVPLWGTADRYNGTSMASPMTAGAVCNILSGLSAEGKDWNFGTIKRALRATGKELPGYTAIDIGGGVLDLPHAWKAAVAYADAGEADKITLFTTSTDAPFQPDGEAPAIYWRGGWFPSKPHRQTITISPRFPDWVSADARNTFYRAFRLSTDASWIQLDRNETYINADSEQSFRVSYGGKDLETVGMHVGRIFGKTKGADRSGDAAYDFEMTVTIITPERFNSDNGYARRWNGRTLAPGSVHRYFVRVPAGATGMDAVFEIPEGQDGYARPVFFDPDGRQQGPYLGYADGTGDRKQHFHFSDEDLQPGVWEIVARGSRDNGITSSYDLGVSFSSFTVQPAVIESLEHEEPAAKPSFEVTVTPRFDEVYQLNASGSIDKYVREREVEVEESDSWSYEFEISDEVPSVDFELEMCPKVYNSMTDAPVNIYDASGKAVQVSGFGQRFLSVGLEAAAPGRYTLKVDAGFALAEDKEKWGFHLEESFHLRESAALEGTLHDEADFRVYPDAAARLVVEAAAAPPRPPEGFVNGGELQLTDATSGVVRLRIPVRLAR